MTGQSTTSSRRLSPLVWASAAALSLLSLWAFWPTLEVAARRWLDDPQYSHGYLVPLFSLVLLWQRGDRIAAVTWGAHALGLVFLAGAFALRIVNLLTRNSDWLDGVAFVFAIAGVVGLVGGMAALRWAWPAVAFLIFMLPLPYGIERALGGELQSVATKASTTLLQLIGLPAISEGNVILLNDLRLGVAEACSGLSMLLIFVALSVAFASVVRRPLLDRGLLIASSVPIALLANIVRITVTGALHVWVGSRIADLVFHDLAGWLMMPLALALLWVELKFLSYVLVDEPVPEPTTAVPDEGAPAGRDRAALPVTAER